MFRSIILAATVAAVGGLALQPALADTTKELRGAELTTTVQSNTLSGKDQQGKHVHLYLLPGGTAAFDVGNETSGVGTWNTDSAGDLCVNWAAGTKADSGCYQVSVDDNKVTFLGKSDAAHRGGLFGETEPLKLNKKPN